MTRIAVLGTGANGAAIGADLTRAGLDVTFVEQWPAHVEAMRANGLRVEMPDETVTTEVRAIHLCEVAELRHSFDVVLVLMKAYDTRWACELIKPYVAADGLVVGVQNGMTIHTIADVMGADRALGAVLEVSSAMYHPGIVERHTPPSGSWFTVGGIDPSTLGREWEVVDLLKHAGTVEVADDIVSSKWMKLVVNCAELVTTAIVNMPMKEAYGIPEMRDFMLAVGREAMRTAVALGNRVVPIFGLTDIDPNDPDRALEQMVGAVFGHFSLPTTKTTVLHDWMKGRHSEVDELNGAIVRGAAELGTEAPANARVVEIAHRVERGDLPYDRANLDMLLSGAGL
jgi:2-dehydropantoate 2-reductase